MVAIPWSSIEHALNKNLLPKNTNMYIKLYIYFLFSEK